MKKIRRNSIMIMLLLCVLTATENMFARETDTIPGQAHFRLKYIINSTEIDSKSFDNANSINDIKRFLELLQADSTIHVDEVRFRGTASPDGSYEFNQWLGEERLKSFKDMVFSYVTIPDSVIHISESEITWSDFRSKVADSDIPYREEVLAIIDEGPGLVPFAGNKHIDHRLPKLKNLGSGVAWQALKNPILSDLRYGDARFFYTRHLPVPQPPLFDVDVAQTAPLPDMKSETPEVVYVGQWIPKFYIKSNLIGWGLLSANVAFEFDLARHWSFTLPAYYSALDWFKSTIKFRNITVQPEFRYWPRSETNDGFFIGAHFGLCYYNLAFDGEHRYQDHDGRTPALGGGLAVGYRLPISKNRRWRVEFSAGAGAYSVDYDVFMNTPHYQDGQLIDRRKKTYIGLDQAQITFSYSFDLKKRRDEYMRKGGAR